MKRPDVIIFPGSKDYRYGLIIDKYQSHSTQSLIGKRIQFYVSNVGGSES
jgi:hypothetical protein